MRWWQRSQLATRGDIHDLWQLMKEKLMSVEQDLQDKMDAISTKVDNAGTEIQSLKDQIAAIPSGSVVTQPQLDALTAQADKILGKLTTITA